MENTIAQEGQAAAVKLLSMRGYEILDESWELGEGEVGIVASDDEVLVFASVRTTSVEAGGGFSDGPDREVFEIAAMKWLAECTLPPAKVRFDSIAIVAFGEKAMVRHAINVFGPLDR